MPLTKKDQQALNNLKRELQRERQASKLENLAAALIGRLLGVQIAVAKSGFQHGADAGPSGRQGRRFRIECKKYSDTTNLSDRELLGEIDQALARDEALEAWILVATRNVPEQLEQSLTKKGDMIGVPIVILDWKDDHLGALPALCAFGPDIVESEFSKEAAEFALALKPIATDAIEMLRRDLQSWCLGFESLRSKSHEKLEKIWTSPRESNAELGQNAAGGASNKKITRVGVQSALDTWWHGPAKNNAPAAVLGLEGVGKTWATLDWLVSHKQEQPIILVIPSSAVANQSAISDTQLRHLLADRLYELTGVRDSVHWLRRLDLLLKRPSTEGPVLTVFLDGLNQEPSAPWLPLLKVLQGEKWTGRTRVILSTRNHHFETKLSQLRGLAEAPALVPVDVFSTEPGGELDQMLTLESLTRSDLHPDLIKLACNPRLFALVVRFRGPLVDAGEITVHRLLWEYGRDSLDVRGGKSFSESEWRAWLKSVAQNYLDGIRKYSIKDLGETLSRRDLETSEVFARLSDIVDGPFANSDASGDLNLTPTVINHALGAALLAQLDEVGAVSFGSLHTSLVQWLDPIAGFDQRAEILRAAVSIHVEAGRSESPVVGVLVTEWLQTQNLTDEHRMELTQLAHRLAGGLLDAVEHSDPHVHASARRWAINALRAIPRTHDSAIATILNRVGQWFRIVSRDTERARGAHDEVEKRRSARYQREIGVDIAGPVRVLGVDIELVDHCDGMLQSAALSIIEGFPMAQALPIFEAAATALAIRGRSEIWDGLKWLCLLNEIDPDEMAKGMRELSSSVRFRQPEKGVDPKLPTRVGALLLRLTGIETDEDTAVSFDPGYDGAPSYETDYLIDPSHSIFFPLERRHAERVLNDLELPFFSRISKTEDFWLDPTFAPPRTPADEACRVAGQVDVERLHEHGGRTLEDHQFEQLEPVLARCAPSQLAELIHRKMLSLPGCSEKSRYWRAINGTDYFLLAGEPEAAAARALRLRGPDIDAGNELFAAHELLILELANLDALTQFDRLIQVDHTDIVASFAEILRTPTPQDVDVLIARYGAGTTKQKHDLVELLAVHPIRFSDQAWTWISGHTKDPDENTRGLAFWTLACSDPTRFGQALICDNWSWRPEEHFRVNHYGSEALIQSTMALPFEDLAPRLAPWLLLKAARQRGENPEEIRLAAVILDHTLTADNIVAPDPGSTLQNADAKDFAPLHRHAPDMIERWIAGFREPTPEFKRRFDLAEGVFLALCETLLACNPTLGVELWRSIRSIARTRYIGAADVDGLLHMVFRVIDSQPVVALRNELLGLAQSKTDKALLNLAIAAATNGHADWLDAAIQADQGSSLAWKRARGTTLSCFKSNNQLPVTDAWPDGEQKTSSAELRQMSARSRWIEACARHWWQMYLMATNATEAYAAWVLFLHSADRRAWIWLYDDANSANDNSEFFQCKLRHLAVNKSALKRAMKQREDKLDERFLGRKIVADIGPWKK